uniref:YncE family protein n=2 Tax=Methylobacterium haplocladii TaxID=1176176 RepID=UPI0028063B46|nr:YncE family protein [Methylobacterium haplocladii]
MSGRFRVLAFGEPRNDGAGSWPTVVMRSAWLATALLVAATPVSPASIFVASQGASQLARIDTGTNTVTATTQVQTGPAAVAADARGRLYLSHPDASAITIVEGETARVLKRLTYKGQAFGIAADPLGRFVYVGDWTTGRVSRLSAETGAVEGVVAVGKDPANLVLDRAGRIWVADRESHQVSVIDAARMERVATIAAGEAPFALCLSPSQNRLYVANVRSNDLTVIDTAALKVVATVPVGAMPYGVATSADGARILVSNQHAGTVTILDANSLTLTDTITVGRYPEGIVVADARAYVANWFSDDVSVIDLATLRETGRIKVGAGPRNLGIGQTGEAGR